MSASPKFKTVITNYGKQRLIAAMSPGGTKITLAWMAVGDGGGNPTTPDAASTALVNEVWRAAVNSVTVDKKHPNTIIADLIIPAKEGGFWIREAGIYDELNKLVAICNLPASEKPLLEEGSGRDQTVRMTLVVSDTSIVNITIDSTTIIATNDYVNSKLKEHEESRNHPDATLEDKGFVRLSNATDSDSEEEAATPKAVKAAFDLAKGALAKDQNGGDIPDKQKFIENLGLTETVEQARNAVPSTRKVNGKALTTDITLTSGDIGALPVTGGKLNGPLGIGTDNALGGNSIVLGDNDTGLKQDGDGVLGIYANNARVGYIDNSGLHMLNDVYSGDAHLGGNGDIFGSVWGGWLNDFLNNNYNRKNTASLGDYGWVRDESTGFIMQWGTLGSSNGTYNFPREFPASCFAVFVTNTSQQGGAVDNAFGYPVSKSQFFAATKASTDGNVVNNYPVAWFAIGR
ncbi:phage tail protein [Salmonella enterica]|nr:phage tail protein [Salmonella enterica]ECC3899296.1 phage tail protein [Salmonella enterica subsp. enterica]EDV9252442.1 phage tail protein [Salmonella enterica subsp. enterica serovar Sundsvall]EBC2539520.1 phage tail protein [Salmonella enterica]EBC2887895.1 phage tail protein [Salmonella enterica]